MRLLFVTSNRLGDAVLSTGLLQHLIDENPGIRVTVVSGAAPAALFDAVPGLDRQITIRKKSFHGHWLSLWMELVSTRWDIAVDLRRSALLPLLAAKRKLVVPKAKGMVHRVALLGEMVGRASQPPAPKLWWSEDADKQALNVLGDTITPVLAIGPTANWQGKIWPAERFVEAAQALTAPGGVLPGARVAVFGAPGEKEQATPVLQSLPKEQTIDLIGELSLPGVAACLSKCSLYIGNDSGLMHMAAATGIPTLGLFGPSHTELYAPWGQHAQALRTPEAYGDLVGGPGYDRHTVGSLMTGLTVDTVIQAATSLVQRSASPEPSDR